MIWSGRFLQNRFQITQTDDEESDVLPTDGDAECRRMGTEIRSQRMGCQRKEWRQDSAGYRVGATDERNGGDER